DVVADIDGCAWKRVTNEVAQGRLQQLVACPQNSNANQQSDSGIQPQPAGQGDGDDADEDADGGPDIGEQMVPIGIKRSGTVPLAGFHQCHADAKVNNRGGNRQEQADADLLQWSGI